MMTFETILIKLTLGATNKSDVSLWTETVTICSRILTNWGLPFWDPSDLPLVCDRSLMEIYLCMTHVLN